jgi:hypothetical protein
VLASGCIHAAHLLWMKAATGKKSWNQDGDVLRLMKENLNKSLYLR